MLLYLSYSEQYNYNLSEVIPGLYQEYVDVHPVNCDRGNNPNRVNKIDNLSLWEVTIPHPWLSGSLVHSHWTRNVEARLSFFFMASG